MQKGPSFEDSWRIEIRRGLLQYAVLAIVKRYEAGIHGYGIAKELEVKTEGLLQVKEGTLYPILHRLKKERLLNVHDQKSESASASVPVNRDPNKARMSSRGTVPSTAA